MPNNVALKLNTGTLQPSKSNRHLFSARFVRAGRVKAAGNRDSNIIIDASALETAYMEGLFDSKSVFVDHAGFWDHPSVKNLSGVTRSSHWNEPENAVTGEIEFYDTPLGNTVSDLLLQILEEDNPPDIGLSIVFYPQWHQTSGSEDRHIVGITHIESIDLVFEPAADGRILHALSSFFQTEQELEEATIRTINHRLHSELSDLLVEGANTMQDELENVEEIEEIHEEVSNVNPSEDWQSALETSTTRAMIQSSGLPSLSQDHLQSRDFSTPDQVNEAIEAERSYLASLQENNVVDLGGEPPRSPAIAGMMNSLDRVTLAYEALLAGVNPDGSIPPLTGIRELYMLLSGDYEMTGLYHPDRIQFANVTTATMANITADLLNKRVMAEFQVYPQWWLPIVNIEDFPTLQDAKWIVLGGVGELPTVAEGAAYTELDWDDQKESDAFVKKGGYLGITLEAIDKDDTNRLRAAPRALAQAAWLTLSKAISEIFTSNTGVGPTLSDSLALFHTTHANLGTTALSVTTWNAARIAMRKMTELNSGERLGALTAPKFLLVPPDLEMTALQVLASEYDYTYALSNGTAAPANVYTEGDQLNARMQFARSRVVVVDLWSDTNNWAASGDPRLYPTIGLGYRYGRTPEIFSVASPTAGLMFTNDTMPVKVRYFFATGPVDYRNLYKANVA